MIRALLLCVMATGAGAGPLFEDHSDALGPHSYSGGWEHFVGGGVSVLDCNDDSLPDIFAAGGEAPAALWKNTGAFTFERTTIAPLTGVTGAYPLDIDGDDILDLFVMRVGPNVVLQGTGDCTFTDATDRWGMPAGTAWTTSFSAWWDGDRPTMALGNYVDRDDPEGPFGACDDNAVLIPQPNGYTQHVLTPGYCALSMLAARDASGQHRLRISNDRHYYLRDGAEQMWDTAAMRFLTEADGWPRLSVWGMGIASRDITGDGRDEVVLTSMGDQLMQLAQADGTYIAAPFSIGTYAQRPHTGEDGRPSTGWHAQFGDINNDTRPDLFIAKGNVDQMPGLAMADPNNLLMQNVDGTFFEAATHAGVATTERSRGAALVDFDGDGLLDLVVNNRRADIELYRNVSPATGHWITLDLRSAAPNTRAVGAQVTVNGQSQQVMVGGGHAGGQAGPLHFGLGDAEQAEVRVIWPNGNVTDATLDTDAQHILHPVR
ncbi:CRTAC1 family protein [Yoonia sp. MH D7]